MNPAVEPDAETPSAPSLAAVKKQFRFHRRNGQRRTKMENRKSFTGIQIQDSAAEDFNVRCVCIEGRVHYTTSELSNQGGEGLEIRIEPCDCNPKPFTVSGKEAKLIERFLEDGKTRRFIRSADESETIQEVAVDEDSPS